LMIDYILSHFIRGRQKPIILGILRLGVCELLYMSTPTPAACDQSVKLTREVGKAPLCGYVNGVLRAIARAQEAGELPPLPRDPIQQLSIRYSWPQWLVQEWVQTYGEADAEKMLSSAPPPLTLRPQWPYQAEELANVLTQRNISFARGQWVKDCLRPDSGWDVAKDPLFLDGCMTVQSESAVLVCQACAPRPGMKILDICAAPGGKTACLWSLAQGECELHAWELHEHRKELLDKTLQRLHVPAQTAQRDASQLAVDYRETFDVVLVDAPCSGLGVTGKPDIRYQKTDADILALCQTQKSILHTAAQYVKKGGTLIYATCTISRRENEEQVEAFLEAHKDFHLASLEDLLPKGLCGLESGMVQLFPHRDGTEGFFMARMERCKA